VFGIHNFVLDITYIKTKGLLWLSGEVHTAKILASGFGMLFE
jgi:hypothetical protein